MSELVLWSDDRASSPWVHAAWVALKEKGLSFRVAAVPLGGPAHRSGPLARHTIGGRVPALQRGDFWLAESWAIVEWLEEVYPPPGYPALLAAEPDARARDRELASWLRASMGALRAALPYEGIFEGRELKAGEPPKKALPAAAATELAALVRVADARWAAGAPDQPTLADFELAFHLRRPVFYGHPIEPPLLAATDAVWWRPASASFVEQVRPLG